MVFTTQQKLKFSLKHVTFLIKSKFDFLISLNAKLNTKKINICLVLFVGLKRLHCIFELTNFVSYTNVRLVFYAIVRCMSVSYFDHWSDVLSVLVHTSLTFTICFLLSMKSAMNINVTHSVKCLFYKAFRRFVLK